MTNPQEPLPDVPARVRPENRRVALYFGLLFVGLNCGLPGGVADLPVNYFLKDRLHASAEAVALFGFVAITPVYVDFLFGFLRDRLKANGWSDRAAFLFIAPLVAAIGLWTGLG